MDKGKRYIDLSDIKDDDLDKTASFHDLMSRSERKRREKEKIQEEVDKINDDSPLESELTEIQETLFEQNDSKKLNDEINERENLEDDNSIENKIHEALTYNENDDESDNDIFFEKENNKNSLISIVSMGLFNIISIVYFIYSIIFTEYLNNKKYFIINGALILLIILSFGLTIISNKDAHRFFKIFNYLFLLSFIALNIGLTLGYIK